METINEYKRCFEYPIDSATLLSKKRKIRKAFLQDSAVMVEKRIAILGGSTTNEISDQIGLFLLYHGIKGTFYQSEYGQYWQDAMFGTEELDSFHPDIIYIHINWRNIEAFPDINSDAATTNEMLESEFNRLATMWETLENKFHCPIIQDNFDRPNFRLMGNRDMWDYRGRTNYISRLNQKLYSYAQSHESFFINDVDYLAAEYGLSKWSDPFFWYMYKYSVCLNGIPHLANSVANIIKSIYGKNKKVLALDLDNTLWGGVIGDDGVEGIKIGNEVSEGQVFSEFQSYCKELKKIGVVLAVSSKNEMENAISGLSHPDSILREDDFVSIKANWNPKSQNIVQIASDLNLGVDSFVFADDNPAEREIVRSQVPGVSVPEMSSPETYIETIDHSGYYEVTSISKEDLRKTEIYKENVQRQKQILEYSDYGEYLNSLEMTAQITGFQEIQIQRIAQLTNKSNQFNLTTLRCSEDDIRTMARSKNFICLSGRLLDKFGDNGIVAVSAGEIIGKTLHLRLWLMSCRVLKREMEDAMMNEIVKKASDLGIENIRGYYYPTVKNGMVKEFYGQFGFDLESDNSGATEWGLSVNQYKEHKIHMKVEGEE